MKHIIKVLILTVLVLQSCETKNESSSIEAVNWEKRFANPKSTDSLTQGSTYLSIYSQIYSETEKRVHNLTATVSIRNTSLIDTLYIDKADYYNTHGDFIRSYFKSTIYIAPMETVEIVINERDKEGGTGANFIFDWSTYPNSNEPLFEAVMISTYGQQGLSFTSQGKRLK